MFSVGDKIQYIGVSDEHFDKWGIYTVAEVYLVPDICGWQMDVIDMEKEIAMAKFDEFRLVVGNDNEGIVFIADDESIKFAIEIDYFKITRECSNL